MASILLTIRGMTCEHCRKTVEGALTQLAGVWGASANVEEGCAEVQFDGARVTSAQLIEAVTAAGYGAEVTG